MVICIGRTRQIFLVRKGKSGQAFPAGALFGDNAIPLGMDLAPEGWGWRHPAMASSVMKCSVKKSSDPGRRGLGGGEWESRKRWF